MKKCHKKSALLSVLCLTAFCLTACGGVTGTAGKNNTGRSASGTAVQTKGEDMPSLSVSEQLDVILTYKEMWLKEDSRRANLLKEEADMENFSEGPYYSLMDLDQDGYIECVVSDETNQTSPVFYEVTRDKTLKQWTTKEDFESEKKFGRWDFTHTGRADCFYDSSDNRYHYITLVYHTLTSDEADASYLEMTPAGDHVTIKTIGRYFFDAHTDNKRHYSKNGKECSEAELFSKYDNMKRKTIYHEPQMISLKEGESLTADALHSLWNKYIIRDSYRSEKEKDLTNEIQSQLYYFSWAGKDMVTEQKWEKSDTIRYTATDLNHNNYLEIIIENKTKNDYFIYEENEIDMEDEYADTKGKSLTSFTQKAEHIDWQTCTIDEFLNQNDKLLEDLLRECWLKFS